MSKINAKLLSAGILLSIIALTISCKDKNSTPSVPESIVAKIDTLLAQDDIEALTIGIVKQDIVYKIHRGKLLTGETPNDQTLYEIASLTKTFTGTLLAKAIVDGKVELEEDIRLYLPEKYPNLAYEGHPITFKHLVTHQSGLPLIFPEKEGLLKEPIDWDKLPFEFNELQENFSKEQFFKSLRQFRLDTIPGIQFTYSNAGANLLGYLLENIYEESFDLLLEQYIFQPLEMTQSSIRLSEVNSNRLAKGLNMNKIEMPYRVEKAMNAEGGIISNVEDMIKYMQYHLNTSDATVATSHQELWEGQYGDYEAGLFWQIFKDGDQPDRIYQNGGAFGTSSWMTLIPELETAIFLVTNSSGQNVHQKLSEAADGILSEL
ncbi:MAG: serine hydrolase domain-containing protein [Bacteroidota bacterium]